MLIEDSGIVRLSSRALIGMWLLWRSPPPLTKRREKRKSKSFVAREKWGLGKWTFSIFPGEPSIDI